MRKESPVPVQKGPIEVAIPTQKTMTHEQRQVERQREIQGVRDGQTLKFHTPKR
jgi:hypothetical protein